MDQENKNPKWCGYKEMCPFWSYLDNSNNDDCAGCFFHEDEVKKRKELRDLGKE